MQIINTINLNEARKKILEVKKKNSNEKIALLSQDDEFNRKALEIKGLSCLIINEAIYVKDYMKQRNSGLNEVLAKICTDKGIEIGIQIDEIIKKNDADKAKALARLNQNILLCKRTKTKLVFISEKNHNKQALNSILLTFKASNQQI